MRFRTLVGSVFIALALQGCVGTGSVISQAQQQSLQSLQLFKADSSPRFTFYLACTSEDASCVAAEHAFSDWARDRHVTLRAVEPGDRSFKSGQSSTRQPADMPYRVAVRFAPLIVPSFNLTSVNASGTMDGGYVPPKVGYTATIHVFDAATGKLLLELPAHEQRVADFKADAGEYIRSEVRTFVAGLDPAYPRK
jgi:hypothetical protein